MKKLYWMFSVVLIVLDLGLMTLFAQVAVPIRLPPPPVTVQPTATPTEFTSTARPGTPQSDTGAWIEMQLIFPEDWPWERQDGRALFTVVEWQDALGRWHPIEGWQGGLDEIDAPPAIATDTPVVGYKVWWVPKSLLGQGPFRWLVYTGAQGTLLARSAPFDLPERTGQRRSIKVVLESLDGLTTVQP